MEPKNTSLSHPSIPKLIGRGGPGRGQGRKPMLKNAKVYKFYLDDDTIEALKKVHPNRSKAVRMLVGTDPAGPAKFSQE